MHTVKFAKSLAAAAGLSLLAVGFTGCAGSAADARNCTSTLKPGNATDAVEVTGKFGSEPTVEIPEGTRAEVTQREVLESTNPDGRVAKDGDLVSLNFAVYEADTGTEIDSTPFSSTVGSSPVKVTADYTFTGLYEGLKCAREGERLLLAISSEDGIGAESAASWGISPDATLIMIADVVSVGSDRAEGEQQQLPNGFPNVVTDSAGRVGIVLPPSAPPTELREAARIQGEGTEVAAEMNVFAQVLTVNWQTRQVLFSSWQNGSPTSLGVEAGGPELRKLVTGHNVGSQLVVMVPTPEGVQVSVIDILGVG